jgi:hypothetical protein
MVGEILAVNHTLDWLMKSLARRGHSLGVIVEMGHVVDWLMGTLANWARTVGSQVLASMREAQADPCDKMEAG